MNITDERPAVGVLSQGQSVYVVTPPNYSRHRGEKSRYCAGTIVKIGRVWITVQSGLSEYRLRLDNQTDGSQYSGSSYRFLTEEQRAWELARNEAEEYLQAQGIHVAMDSPWRPVSARIRLAEILKMAQA